MSQLVTTDNKLYNGQGSLIAAIAINGVAGKFFELGNLEKLEVTLKRTATPIKETQTGQGGTLRTDYHSPEIEIAADLHNFNQANAKLLLKSAGKAMPAKTVTGETLLDDLIAGDIVRLKGVNVSSVVIKDSASSPATLDPGEHYISTPQGSVKFLDVTGFTQPFKADYAQAASTSMTILSGNEVELWLSFEGLNRAENMEPVLVDFYRCQTDLLEKITLLTETSTTFPLKASVLLDPTKQQDDEYGYFGRVVMINQP
ncbi:phage tail tube protein [Chitinimonas koreensis]|uniref:phage tail tube protein n=1 Tax=Chitinimonas koreensis TaxID=356302 RepID=UPI0004233CC8|nr:hypothetical protein [Chitinimonas koreensis]QNM94900.1 hypothetical protein H9L41_13310 [Chitinimonas koreensis]